MVIQIHLLKLEYVKYINCVNLGFKLMVFLG